LTVSFIGEGKLECSKTINELPMVSYKLKHIMLYQVHLRHILESYSQL